MTRLSLILMLLLSLAWSAGSVLAAESFVAAGSLQSTLEYNRTNQASTWVNPDTGLSGSAVPTRTYQNGVGQPCREFTQTIIVAGEEQQGYGTACRQPDGSWQIVSPQTGAAVATALREPQRVVYVREVPVRRVYYDPYPYYPYGYARPYPYAYYPYYPVSLAFSFGWFHSSGHRHGGHSYRGYGGGHRGGGHYARGSWGGHGSHGGGGWRGGHGGGRR